MISNWEAADSVLQGGDRPACRSVGRSPRDPLHGYALTDVHELARLAVHTAWAVGASDWLDRYDAAWHGIVEHLLTATEPPSRRDLCRAGQDAVTALALADRRHRGYRDYSRTSANGPGTGPRFAQYWEGQRNSPSHEERLVEHVALGQILTVLTARERQALDALAAAGGHAEAAALMGVTTPALNKLVGSARRKFLALWHEGEAPSVIWRRIMPSRLKDDAELVACGHPSAFARHKRRGEPVDEACMTAERDRQQAWREGRKAKDAEAA